MIECWRILSGISVVGSRDSDAIAHINSSYEFSLAPDIMSECILENRVANLCLNGILANSLNVQCVSSHLTELGYRLDSHRPHDVMMQDSWPDDKNDHIVLSNCNVVSHRGRENFAGRGGRVLPVQVLAVFVAYKH